jgi:hypothetical protein
VLNSSFQIEQSKITQGTTLSEMAVQAVMTQFMAADKPLIIIVKIFVYDDISCFILNSVEAF